MKIVIRGARVVDPASGLDTVADVAIAAGHIVGIGKVDSDFNASKVIRGEGRILLPGLVDLAKIGRAHV